MLTLLPGPGTTDASAGKEDIWAVMWMSGEAAEEMEACTDAEVRIASSLAIAFHSSSPQFPMTETGHLRLPLRNPIPSAEQLVAFNVFRDDD